MSHVVTQVTTDPRRMHLPHSNLAHTTSHVLAPNLILSAARREVCGEELVRAVEVLVGGAHAERRPDARPPRQQHNGDTCGTSRTQRLVQEEGAQPLAPPRTRDVDLVER